jgi:hypothetical protein
MTTTNAVQSKGRPAQNKNKKGAGFKPAPWKKMRNRFG